MDMTPYNIDFAKKGELKNHIRKFLLHPERWRDVNNQLPITLNWFSCKFTDSNRAKIPKEKGIYCFVLQPEYGNFIETRYLFYAGKTNRTLWDRYKEYLNDQSGKGKPRSKIYEMLHLYRDDVYFYYSVITDSKNVNICEEKLINTFVPHINTHIPDAKINPEVKYIYE